LYLSLPACAPLNLSLPAFVPFLACHCTIPCLPLYLSVSAFVLVLVLVPFLACLCAFSCLPLYLYLYCLLLHLCYSARR
jgi:hypothetical protein